MDAYKLNRERNVQALIHVNAADIEEPAGEELDEEVGTPGGADAERGAAQPLEREPPLADERAGVAARLGVEPAKDLDDQLLRQTRIDPIMASHF